MQTLSPIRALVPALLGLALAALPRADGARADVPSVTSDIPPVHSLVAQVMGELGRPSLLVSGAASPHHHALRPSEAAAIEASDVVFWTDRSLTPWLAREIGTLAPDALSVELMTLDGVRRYAAREGERFERHAHGDEGHDDEDHDGADHDGDGHAHEDGAHDPHGWLDPSNAVRWLDEIAAVLSRLDADNADVYAANAAEARRALEALVVRTESSLVPVRGRGFVVFHDSIRYFEERFGVAAVAALSPSDASDASPSRVHRVRTAIEQLDVGCVFTEPQLDARRARVLVDGMDGVRLGVVDPLGAGIEPGVALYEELVDGVTRSLVDCLGDSSGSDG